MRQDPTCPSLWLVWEEDGHAGINIVLQVPPRVSRADMADKLHVSASGALHAVVERVRKRRRMGTSKGTVARALRAHHGDHVASGPDFMHKCASAGREGNGNGNCRYSAASSGHV